MTSTKRKTPDETAQELLQVHKNVISRGIGWSCSSTIQARAVLQYGPHPGGPGCKYIITGEVVTQSRDQTTQHQNYDGHRERLTEQALGTQVVVRSKLGENTSGPIIKSIHLRRCTHVPSGGSSTTEGIMKRREEIKDRQRQEQLEAVCSEDSQR